MPGIADPGAVLAAEAIAAGVPVFPIPGANAALSALIASGLSAERFTFHGFLPEKEGARRTALESLYRDMTIAEQPETHIFYEAPHRIIEALQEIVAVFGPSTASPSPANSPSSTKSSCGAQPQRSLQVWKAAQASAARWSCSSAAK